MLRTINNYIDTFRSVEPEVLECYQEKLPDMVHVNYSYDKKNNILFASIIGVDKDVLFTQAKNQEELEDMVNDAIITYYDIPYRYARLISINKRYKSISSLKDRKSQLKLA